MFTQRLQEDYVSAMKARDAEKLEVLRILKSQIKYKEIEKKRALQDDEAFEVVMKFAKQLRESITMFEQGGRVELAQQSKAQLKIIEPYLPKQLEESEIIKKIEEIKEKHAEAIANNPKSLIGICMRELKGQADPVLVMKYLK